MPIRQAARHDADNYPADATAMIAGVDAAIPLPILLAIAEPELYRQIDRALRGGDVTVHHHSGTRITLCLDGGSHTAAITYGCGHSVERRFVGRCAVGNANRAKKAAGRIRCPRCRGEV